MKNSSGFPVYISAVGDPNRCNDPEQARFLAEVNGENDRKNLPAMKGYIPGVGLVYGANEGDVLDRASEKIQKSARIFSSRGKRIEIPEVLPDPAPDQVVVHVVPWKRE